MDGAKLRAFWSFKQGLDGSLEGASPAEVLKRSGWARSVGGVGPYLTFFSRAGLGREAVDGAVKKLEIHELPSARGCTYVVPAEDFALALTLAQENADAPLKPALKLGVTEKEIEKLKEAVLKALSKGPLEPNEIREAVGSAARSLGEEGKKKGLSTTMSLALGPLQASGDIRRIPTNGRLDQQRYAYTLWKPNPLAKVKLSIDDAYASLARKYFRWTGPATLGEFQWFSGLGVKAAKSVIEPLGLVPVEKGSDRLAFPEDAEAFAKFKAPTKPQYALVSSLDAISVLRRDVRTLLDDEDAERDVLSEKGKAAQIGGLSDLPNHAILDRGRLVGLWEFDTAKNAVVWASFGVKDKALAAAVAETERYIREDLGDARSFSLDSPKSREPKLAALRKAAG